MGRPIHYRRLAWFALLLGLGFAGLAARLVYLQVLRHDELLAKAQQNTQREFMLEPRRGDILDARGNLLATSIFVKTVCADPVLIGNRQAEVARALAPLLQLNETDLFQRLLPRTRATGNGGTATNRYVVLQHRVSAENWQRIQQAMAGLTFGVDEKHLPRPEQSFYNDLRAKAIFADPHDDQLRVFPNGTLAAHVLGYIGQQTREINSNRVSVLAGMEGVECMMDAKLAGVAGWRVTETDRQKRELVTLREQDVEPHNGLNVTLTLDAVIQHIAETALADAVQKHSPVSASAIVVRPRTGEILAMATLPNFDPNSPGAAPADARRNRVISDVHEPGSTFKIVVVSGALNDGLVRLTDQFDCEHGHFAFAGHVLHDHESYGTLTVEGIITKSSNIGAAKIGIKMEDQRLYHYIREFGFGDRTGIPLVGEVGGIVHPVKDWSKVSIAQIPMGHGVAVTPLQMTMAMCAIANHGQLMRPMLVSRLEDENHNLVAQYFPQPVRQILSESADREMVEALKTVVSPDGTAPKAAMDHYTVAGKTGTAQKAEHGVYVSGKYFSSFIGFFPADNPEICIAVMLDEPREGYYGGQVSGPVFKQIAERTANYLNIKPDRLDDDKKETVASNRTP
jgi:cell division protein FtsI (penicillin-binding protein 3)